MKASDVHSPRLKWVLIDVLYDAGEGEDCDSVALGRWDREPVLAARWNGAAGHLGNPVSTGKPTWFVLPKWYYPLVLGSDRISSEKRKLALTVLGPLAQG